MKAEHFEETQSLYLRLRDDAASATTEVTDGVLLDLNRDGEVVGIDIDNLEHLARYFVALYRQHAADDPRRGWEQAFKSMAQQAGDTLLDPDLPEPDWEQEK